MALQDLCVDTFLNFVMPATWDLDSCDSRGARKTIGHLTDFNKNV